jgi:hypothetical protein
VTLALDDKRYDITEISGVPVPGQQIRRSRPLTLSYAARVERNAGIWGYSVDLSHNLPGGNGNNLTAYRSEDPRTARAQPPHASRHCAPMRTTSAASETAGYGRRAGSSNTARTR